MSLPAVITLAAVAAGLAFIAYRLLSRPSFPTKPRQADVVTRIWYGVFGVKRRWWLPWVNRPPTVDWLEGSRLDYADGHAWTIQWDPDGTGPKPAEPFHISGLAHPELKYVQVAWPADTTSFAQTALVHELWHCYLGWFRGDGNPEHTDAGFQAGGIVAQGNDLLRQLGY